MAAQASVHYDRGLRLLSIDGGGIRGLSPLFMLKQILYRIQHEKQLSDLPRPCDVFDLAGGTGTGGLIVIMLFRLQMSVDEAIHAYTTLTENIFSSKNWTLGGYEDMDIPRLHESMVSIISQRSNEDPMLINMVNEDGSKCFVSVMLSGHAKDPTLFRSWSNADQDHTTVVQAAWATTRAPLFFNVVEHNNPVKYVVEEANTLFPGRSISCVLSLGTGTAEVIGLKQPDAFQNVLPQNLISLLKDIAEECERQSNTMETQLHQGDVPDFYFRLNVDEGLQSVSLAEWDILNEVSAHTLRYLEKPDVEQKVDWLLQIVKDEPGPTSSPHSAEEDTDLVPSTVPEPSFIMVPLYRLLATSTEDSDTVPSAAPEPSSIAVPLDRLPVSSTSEVDGVVPSAVPEPLSIIVPLSRLPATPISEGDNSVPSAVPEPSSITFPLDRFLETSTSEVDGVVPSAVPEPLSIIVPLSRLPTTSVSEGDDFVPSAVPESSSITFPLYRLPETSAGDGDDFVPFDVPEPSSITLPLHRLPATGEEATSADVDNCVPSVAPDPSSITVSLYKPVSTSFEGNDFVPSAVPEPSSITVPIYRSTTTSLEDDSLVPSAEPEPSSITTPLYRSQDITSVEGDNFVPSPIPEPRPTMVPLNKLPESVSVEDVPSAEVSTVGPPISASGAVGDEKISYGLPKAILGAAKISPPTELSTSEDEAYFKFWKRSSPKPHLESPEGSVSSICIDGTRKEEIEAIMKWIEADEVKKPLLVVLGPIGTGKTTLLNTISQRSKADGYCAAAYFFSGTDYARNTPDGLISTITYQITEAIPEFRPYVARIIEAGPSILDRSIESQTQRVLLEPLRQLKADYPGFSVRPLVIIIDALDECGELNDQIRVITAVTEVLKQEHIPFLCLLSCRLDLPIAHEISTTHAPLIHDQVILGKDEETEKADIWVYLGASITRIRDKHVFRTHIPEGWPAESDLETIVKRSGGRFIYPATIIKHLESPSHYPHEQLRTILKVSITKSEADPLLGLYRTMMSSVKNLTDATEILGFHLVRSSPQFWIPKTVEYAGTFNFENHFRSLDADVVLAPLASVLECAGGYIRFYHMSFAQFLLDPARSGEYFVDPKTWQHKVVSQLVTAFYAREEILPGDIEYLIREVKPGTELHKIVSDSFKRVVVVDQRKRLPFGGIFNIWPFVTSGFFDQLQFVIPINKIATVFIQRGEDTVPLPILIKLAPTCQLSNSFLLIELCRTCASLLKKGFIQESLRRQEKGPDSEDGPHFTSPNRLLLFMSYLADYLHDQHRAGKKVLLPQDYLSASLRCLWYLQSSQGDVPSLLSRQLRSLTDLPETFGIYDHFNETSSSVTLGALDALSALLPQTPPSSELFATLKQPFDSAVTSKMPSSSHNALGIIHDYLMQHDPEYPQSEHTVLAGLGEAREDEPPVDFEVFLHRRGSKIPEWINI